MLLVHQPSAQEWGDCYECYLGNVMKGAQYRLLWKDTICPSFTYLTMTCKASNVILCYVLGALDGLLCFTTHS